MKIVNDQMQQNNRIIDALLLLGRVLKSQCVPVIVITLIKSLKALYFVSKHFFFLGGGGGMRNETVTIH